MAAPNDPALPEGEIAHLTQAPFVPAPIGRRHSTNVLVTLECKELVGRLYNRVDYRIWTFGGRVPGHFIRVREGDTVTLLLTNHSSSSTWHNIDLHAVTGPDGGAALSYALPGQRAQLSFLALRSGLYVYHCAVNPAHIAHGMYGLILVEPREGMPPVDREYYVMQGEFYTTGEFGEWGLQGFDARKAQDGKPAYVVFNGAVDSLLDANALSANVGETVRLYVGNGGPNLISSFHVIGEIFDRIYQYGGSQVSQQNVQTLLIPPGGAAIVEFKVEVPGIYKLVDHAMFLGLGKGALGHLRVDGPVLRSAQVDPSRVPASGGEVTLRVTNVADVMWLRAEVTDPDGGVQVVVLTPSSVPSLDGGWEGTFIAPPNTTATPRDYQVVFRAKNAIGQETTSAAVTFTVSEVAAAELRITEVNRAGDQFTLSWTAVAGKRYQVQNKSRLDASTWLDLGGPIQAAGWQTSFSHAVRPDGSQFYRIKQLP
jgi:copper-containing nitrite reductase